VCLIPFNKVSFRLHEPHICITRVRLKMEFFIAARLRKEEVRRVRFQFDSSVKAVSRVPADSYVSQLA
jgi:hypothetical protein